MDLRKTILLLAAATLFLSTVSAQSVQVEGLTAENVNYTANESHVTFYNDEYLNKSVTYRDLFVPEELDDDLHSISCGSTHVACQGEGDNFAVLTDPNSGSDRFYAEFWWLYTYSEPPYESDYDPDGDIPDGFSYLETKREISVGYNEENTGLGRMLNTSLNYSGGQSLEIDVSAHYEHLIVEYTYRNSSGDITGRFQDRYSGEETERIPFKYRNFESSENRSSLSLGYDNIYEKRTNITVLAAYSPSHDFAGFDVTNTSNVQEVDATGLYEEVESRLLDDYESPRILLDNASEYQFKALNLTVREDSVSNISSTIHSDQELPEFKLYILGSSGGASSASWGDVIETVNGVSSGSTYVSTHTFTATVKEYNGVTEGGISFAQHNEGQGDPIDVTITNTDTGETIYSNTFSSTSMDFSASDYSEPMKAGNTYEVKFEGDLYINDYSVNDEDVGAGDVLQFSNEDVPYRSDTFIEYSEGFFNSPPNVSLQSPSNESSGLDNSLALETSVSDPDGDSMNVSFHWGNGTEIASNTGVSNGSTTSTSVSGLDWGTTYTWYVNVSDGSARTQSDTSSFTTQYAPQISDSDFVDNRSSDLKTVRLGLNDQGESDILSYSGLPQASEFSNTSLEAEVDLPFASMVGVSDSFNASDEVEVNVSETDSGLREHSYSHSLDTQRVNQSVTVFNNASGSIGYELVLDLPGSIVQGQSWNGSIPGSSNVTHTGVSEGDWIVNESESITEIGQNTSMEAGIDQQTLYNQSQLRVENTRSFGFTGIDVSSQCSETGSVNVPPGESVVTDACNNNSFSGDWIKNEANSSISYTEGSVLLGKDLDARYSAGQDVEVTNVRASTDLKVDLDTLLQSMAGCRLENSSTQKVPADQISQFSFQRSCSPGKHLNRTPVTKTETEDSYKYEIEFGFKIHSNLTEEEETEYAVKKTWADNWNSRDPTETEAVVDGSGKDIQVDERIINGTEYIVFQIGDQHANSSIHEGTHSATLTYYETKSPGSTSGGGSSGGGGGGSLPGSGSETPVEEVTSDKYNWTVSAITSEDAKTFQISGYPGATFEKYVVVRNTGDSNVTLDIDCVSLGNQCNWVNVSVDRVALNRNSFSEKAVKVSGTVPASFSSEDSPAQFSVRVSDPEFNGSQSGPHVGYVDFTVTHNPFLGRVLDTALKGFEVRKFESPVSWGHPIPYIFLLVPLFWAGVVFGLWSLLEWLSPFIEEPYRNLKWVTTIAVFLFTYVFLP